MGQKTIKTTKLYYRKCLITSVLSKNPEATEQRLGGTTGKYLEEETITITHK